PWRARPATCASATWSRWCRGTAAPRSTSTTATSRCGMGWSRRFGRWRRGAGRSERCGLRCRYPPALPPPSWSEAGTEGDDRSMAATLAGYRITRYQFPRSRVIGDSQVRVDTHHIGALELTSTSGQVGLGFFGALLYP